MCTVYNMWVVLIIIQYTRYPIIVQKIPLHEEVENMSDYLLRHSILRCVRWKTDDNIKISHRYTHLKRENILCVVFVLDVVVKVGWVFVYILSTRVCIGRIRHLLLPIYFAYFLGFYKIFSLHPTYNCILYARPEWNKKHVLQAELWSLVILYFVWAIEIVHHYRYKH